MNRNRVYIEFLIMLLLAVVIGASYGMLNIGKKEDIYSVSVIVNNSSSDRWTAMREGLDQAASDNNIKLNFVSTAEILNLQDEQTLIKRELENGADGIIIQMINSYGAAKLLENISSDAVVMLLETDIYPEDIYATVMPDNEEIGRAIGQSIQEDVGAGMEGKSIGILCGNQAQLSMRQRLAGFNESLVGMESQIRWILESTEANLNAELEEKQKEYPVDVVVALGNDEMETAIDYLMKYKGGTQSYRLYGEGCSEKLVYYLDKGMIQVLTVPNEFNMGYQSIEAIAKRLKHKLLSVNSIKINFLVIDKENLYDEDNQKILFPIVQ